MAMYNVGDLLVDRETEEIYKVIDISSMHYIYEVISTPYGIRECATRASTIEFFDDSKESSIYKATTEELIELCISLSKEI